MFGLFLGDTDFSKIVLKKVKKLNKDYFIIDFSKNNKFAKEKIFITLKSNNEYTEIIIEDDGEGYPSEILSKIGEPYLRSLM